jgi:hypothetical protein
VSSKLTFLVAAPVVGVLSYVLYKFVNDPLKTVTDPIKKTGSALFDFGKDVGDWSFDKLSLSDMKGQTMREIQDEYASKSGELAAIRLKAMLPLNAERNRLIRIAGPPAAFEAAQARIALIDAQRTRIINDYDTQMQNLKDAMNARVDMLNNMPDNLLEYTPIGGLLRLF